MSVPGDRRRVLLKISGEALCEGGGAGLAPDAVLRVAREIEPGVAAGVGIAVVVGGGNFVRGSELDGAWIPRLTADSIGMLATVMNALALRCALEEIGLQARVFSAIPALPEVDPFEAWRCRQHLDGGGVAVLAGGTGHPFFTTDTCASLRAVELGAEGGRRASLRAVELGAELLLKGTKVDGVYSSDPVEDATAVLFERLSYEEVLQRGLKVMDATAIAFCREHRLPIRVFNLLRPGMVRRAILEEDVGTLVCPADR